MVRAMRLLHINNNLYTHVARIYVCVCVCAFASNRYNVWHSLISRERESTSAHSTPVRSIVSMQKKMYENSNERWFVSLGHLILCECPRPLADESFWRNGNRQSMASECKQSISLLFIVQTIFCCFDLWWGRPSMWPPFTFESTIERIVCVFVSTSRVANAAGHRLSTVERT